MKIYKIKHRRTGISLYEGLSLSFKDCLKTAISENVKLDFADLSGHNLSNIDLDTASLRYADFENCNLTGANLSEAHLDFANFTNATLVNACLCFSSLYGAIFKGSFFGATDIAGSKISRASFSTLSAFSLNFIDTAEMDHCMFEEREQQVTSVFSHPPLAIKGLDYPVSCLDKHIKIGSIILSFAEFDALIRTPYPIAGAVKPDRFSNFIRKHRIVLQNAVTTAQIRGSAMPITTAA